MGSLRELKIPKDFDSVIERFFDRRGFSRQRKDFTGSGVSRFLFKKNTSQEGVLVIYTEKQTNFFYVSNVVEEDLRWWIADVAGSMTGFAERRADRLLKDIMSRGQKHKRDLNSWEA
jgi:hypothetical protein